MKDNINIDELLNDSKKLLTEIYFDIYQYFSKKYKNVILLMEIGSFFEIYEYNNIGNAREISNLLNIQLTKKNKSIKEISIKNPLMTGFPNHALDRYLQKLIDEDKYTIIIIKQEGKPPNIKRYLYDIISPAININNSKIENYVTSIYVQKVNNLYFVGYSAIEINTGKIKTIELISNNENPTNALDNVFNLLQSNYSKEIILTLDLNKDCDIDKEIEFLKNFLELDDKKQLITIKKEELNINYINELLRRVFKIKSLVSPIEYLNIEKNLLIIQSLGIVIEYIIEHNKEILKNLDIKNFIFLKDEKFVYLGNNPIKQLEIDKVLKLINKTKTSMGKRLIKERLFNPIFDEIELNKRYKQIEFLLSQNINKKDKNYKIFGDLLGEVYDIERLKRKIEIEKIHPFEINFLYISIKNIIKIYKLLKKNINEIEDLKKYIEKHFKIENLKTKIEDIKENIFKENMYSKIDILENKLKEIYTEINLIKLKIEELGNNEFNLEVREDKEGNIFFTMTKNRFSKIKKDFENTILDINNKKIFFQDFEVKKLTSTIKIQNGYLEELSNSKTLIETKLINEVKNQYIKTIKEIKEKFKIFDEIIDTISKLDVAYAGAYIANKYKYYKPKIRKNKKIFNEIRHPLIEVNEENGIYIPNDINFNEYDGMLLYGINSSGKSSLMKSLGIVIFLAQSGFYVPANIEYEPYEKIFTRIEAKDNLQKGLSTFTVEMLELKKILNLSDNKSLVLGDEIAHGTETYSAIGIVGSAIIELLNKKTNFIFSTHLHELTEIEELQNYDNLAIKHLDVYFDGNKLIYNRKIKDGAGNQIYGIEFAKSIYMNKKFIERALKIRKKIISKVKRDEK